MTDTAQLWDAVKAQLKTTVPNKFTYDANILPAQLLSAEQGTYIIATTEASQQGLERLHHQVVQAIAAVSGQSEKAIRVEIVVNGGNTLPALEANQLPDWTSVSSEFLDFNPYAEGGYFSVSNYITRFWTAHLGAAAMSCMDYIRSFYQEPAFIYDKKAKKNIPNPNWQPWTPARDFHLNELVRALKVSDKKIRGSWRGCHIYGEDVDRGVVHDHCFCHLRAGAGELATGKPTADHPDGKPICHFWRPGLLDLLQAEEIATVQQLGDPANPATVYFKIQVFQPLPLLTPWQMAQLANAVQDAHRKWLSGHGYNLAAWGAIPVERMMSLVKIYPKWLR